MKHSDLGVLNGDLLLFGGPYSNAQATTALFAQATKLGVAADHLICTGDVVAYCAGAAATVDAVRAAGCVVVAGNCEVQLAQNADGCGCGFDAGSTCDLLSVAWYAYARAQLDDVARDWMARLPDVVTFTHHGRRYGVIHGGATDVARFIWQTDGSAVFDEEWDALERLVGPVDCVVAGHSGLPFMRQTTRGLWVNTGVIGMPPHNGAAQTHYAVLSGGKVAIHDLTYDVPEAMAHMEAAGLPSEYRCALNSGYWPSEDVLPDALRMAVSDRG
ncbi:metallophosphoesterase family protein [uncultured Sulfitobacter sp.]|uniref:metallophosphoesterase family protein n=1 Tax=uncultured Sulfitobacter sp. TaxID=191468 RepID=UPI0026293759|nr:metallophosphoesterase family protein [uncultured Sulfitobacter sp.]